MKLRRNKKGFTIIELVIVIAVIGILAAVLIPTFVNLTNKANEAADNALVNNLNKALKMEEQEPGHQKAPTLEGAIKDLEDQGYLLENLASKSGKDLLWSQSENQFLLNTEGKSGKDYWKIVDAVPAKADQKYSYYAGKNFSQTDVTVKYGFDAGRNDGIAKVTYEGTGTAQEVAIRTNGLATNLVVDAEFDTVHHYNHIDELNIEAIAGASYHEHGTVRSKATVSKGHIVVENNAAVNNVIVPKTAAANSVSITVAAKAEIQSVIDYSNGAINQEKTIIPESVPTIAAETGKVAYVKSTNTNYTTFAAAYAATGNDDLIILLDNVDVTGNNTYYDVLVNKSIRIDGNGYNMTSSRATGSAGGNNSSRIFQVENLDNDAYINVTLENIKMNVNAKTNVFVSPSSQYINLVLENCNFQSPYYPINVRASSQFINIDIKDGSFIKGWCALNFYGSLSTLKVTDSILHGYNTQKGNSNEYAVIVLDGGEYWGEAAGESARANTIDIQNSTLIAEVKDGCSEEYWISFQYGSSQNAQVTLKDSKILDKVGGNDKTVAAYFDEANTGDSFTMVLTNEQATGLINEGYTVTPNSDGTSTVRYLA